MAILALPFFLLPQYHRDFFGILIPPIKHTKNKRPDFHIVPRAPQPETKTKTISKIGSEPEHSHRESQYQHQRHLHGNENPLSKRRNPKKPAFHGASRPAKASPPRTKTIPRIGFRLWTKSKSRRTGYKQARGKKGLPIVYGDLKLLCREGLVDEALRILHSMDFSGEILVDAKIYHILLDCCTVQKLLKEGKQVHAHMRITGAHQNRYLAAKLVYLYSACGSIVDARAAFDEASERTMFMWNALLRAYVKNGFCETKAMEIYNQMKLSGTELDNFTFSMMLKACGSLMDLQQGMEIHGQVIKTGYELDVFVGGALVDMYCRCRSVEDANQVFEEMRHRDVVTWTAMIAGLVHNGFHGEALECFRQIQVEEHKPNSATVASVLPACGSLAALRKGKEIHGYIVRGKLDSNIAVRTALMDMYSKCGSVEDANKVFDKDCEGDVIACSIMIVGNGKKGHVTKAFEIFRQMLKNSVMPNVITVVNVLLICGDSAALRQGKELHAYGIKCGFVTIVSLRLALINMYAKCGSMEAAHKVFDESSNKSATLWTAMIAGYRVNGHAEEALRFFHQMRQHGIEPNLPVFLDILPVCADLAVLQEGKKFHAYIIKTGFYSNVFVCSALMNIYTNCGHIELTRKVFDNISDKGVVAWTAIIAAYGLNGNGKEACELFRQMQQTDVKPNHLTFAAVMSACSSAGLVAEAWEYFNCMSKKYDIQPRTEHYSWLVSLLGRTGQLNEALNFIKNMPIKPDAGVWRAVLGACRSHCNVVIGEYAATRLLELEPLNAGNYITLANIYAAAERLDGLTKVRKMMLDRGLKGRSERSWVVVKNRICTFTRGDKSHPQSDEIYATLESIAREMKREGYIPTPNNVFLVDEEDTENIFCGHSEKMAITFGLMNSSLGMPVQVIKNNRMCGDCHSMSKVISKITGQIIIVRDANCNHHFKEGECSCGDYW